jgi:hypothetical protein
MNALDCFLTRAPDRLCEVDRHARESAHDGLHGHRAGGPPYPCQAERASAPVEAWLFGSCGRQGSFLETRAAAAPEHGRPGFDPAALHAVTTRERRP